MNTTQQQNNTDGNNASIAKRKWLERNRARATATGVSTSGAITRTTSSTSEATATGTTTGGDRTRGTGSTTETERHRDMTIRLKRRGK